MREFILYTISGLTTGGIYAITASGLTLTYTTTGVFNFAHGAIGMVAAFTYWQLRFDWGVPALVSFLLVVAVMAPLLGILLEKGIMRRLAGTSEVTRLVVTVALLLGFVSFAIWLWNPNEFRSVRPLWAGEILTWGIVRVSYNDLAVLAIALFVAVGLWYVLYRTRAGVAMRANVDDANLAKLNGSRPTSSARLAWAIGIALAATAGVLVAPKLSLSPLPITLLIVNAYAAAVVGRLRNLPMTFVGALLLGLLNDYAVGYVPKIEIGQQYLRGLVGIVPVVVLFVALLALPTARLRGARLLRSREFAPAPSWRGTLNLSAGVVAFSVVMATVLSAGDLFNITKMWGLAIIGLSCVPLIGYAGQISLCQLTFGGVGAIVVAHLGADGNPVALLWAVLAAAVVGAVVSLPALRLSGIYLALATAAFAVAMDRWIFELPPFTVGGHSVHLFENGALSFTRTRLGPLDLDGDKAYFIAGGVVFALCALALTAVRRSNFGHQLIALKDSPAACATLGINVQTTKLVVFSLSAGIAGLGGAIYAMGIQSSAPNRFEFFAGIAIVLTMVLAGMSSIGAAVVTGFFLGGPALSNLFPSLSQLTNMTVALAGIGLGADPNGFIAHGIAPMYLPLRRTPRLLAGMLGLLVALWLARLADVIDNWGWALLTVGVLCVAPWIAARMQRRAVGNDRQVVDPELSAPVEWLGLARPVRRGDVLVVDRQLHLPAVLHDAP